MTIEKLARLLSTHVEMGLLEATQSCFDCGDEGGAEESREFFTQLAERIINAMPSKKRKKKNRAT